jgi:uncharacterized protein YacL
MKGNISPEKVMKIFYLSGFIIFLIVGISNFFTNLILWDNMILSAKVSSIASNIFNFIVSFVFYSLFYNELKKVKLKINTEDFEKAISKFSK